MANEIGSLRKPIWFLGIAMAVLCVLTTMNFFLLLETREQVGESAAEAENLRKNPIFVEIGPMTVNLQPDSYGERLLYTGLSLRVADEQTRDQLLTHMPEVHSRLLVLLSGQAPESLESASGKETLKARILALFDKPLAEGWPEPEVNGVFFTDFIVQ